MENRYLYRGKRIDNGKWEQGHLITDEQDEKKYFIAYIFGTDEDGQPHDVDSALVDPASICQCTGLKDKNGKLIYENDIMEAHLDDMFPDDIPRTSVVWQKNGWVTIESGSVDREPLDDFDTEHFEVVGNVFDNPELLEV